ncbi:distal tail protein Dit [Shouchella lonarensis]|uniref:Putative phage tail component, N-terminal domain-containing protein n=1 Tax=Shouchella lonarensis TaxID=1464122 RepID=A0A1G6HPU3_9BACI|nr:distal tail protein Dit [Shouchella lonarensis]SDB96260.1 putative phage tail component, N-terminal domain-containing protein [Shouchella lonarensis]
MYRFADTTAGSAKRTSGSIQTIFNDHNLDEELTDQHGSFITLTVDGRDIIEKRIRTQEVPSCHGVREGAFTYAPREIQVKFKLADGTNEGFRDRLNQLNALLLGQKKPLRFSDEDAYFYATLQNGELEEESSNDLIGTLTFICNDPAKYKSKHEISVTTSLGEYVVKGNAPTSWTSRTTFTEESERFILENDAGGKIVLDYVFGRGDVLTIDYKTRNIILNGTPRLTFLSLESNWFQLTQGMNQLQASHNTTMIYTETYY